jgi:hypothetical protein
MTAWQPIAIVTTRWSSSSRARFSAGPLTLTAIVDLPGYVAHVDVDDAGVFLDRGQAQQLADALQRCCAPAADRGDELVLHGLVLHARLGVGPLTLTALSDVRGQVAELEIAVGRDGHGKRSSGVYLDREQAQELAGALHRCSTRGD